MKIFISGGCKNGKSYAAQKLAKQQQKDKLYYIATMRPADEEDERRVIRHQKEREGWGFETVVLPVSISKIIDICDLSGSFLLDSLTALLANEMFGNSGLNGNFNADSIIEDLGKLYLNISDIVVVSDFIYSDARIYDELTENYRRNLAALDCFCANNSDIVLECIFSNIKVIKGAKQYSRLAAAKGNF